MWHEHYDDVARMIARALPGTLAPRERLFGLDAVLGTSAARTMSMIPYQYLRAACKEYTTRDACTRILDTIFRDGDTLVATSFSWRLAQDAGFSDEPVRARKQRYDATWWTLTQFSAPEGAELDDPAMLANAVDAAEQRIKLGEIGWGQRLLQQSGVSEAEAAARYVAARASRQPQ